MTKNQAKNVLKWVQKRLKLTDWTIHLTFSPEPPEGYKGEDADGLCCPSTSQKTAHIWVRDTGDDLYVIDTICHEMVEVLLQDTGCRTRLHDEHQEQVPMIMGSVLAELYIRKK